MWAMRPKKGQSQIKWVAAIPTACSTTAAAPLPRARSVAMASAFTSSWSRLRRKVPSGVQSGHVEMPVRRRTSGKSASMQSWDAAQVSVTHQSRNSIHHATARVSHAQHQSHNGTHSIRQATAHATARCVCYATGHARSHASKLSVRNFLNVNVVCQHYCYLQSRPGNDEKRCKHKSITCNVDHRHQKYVAFCAVRTNGHASQESVGV